MASVSGTNGANGANVYSEVWQKSSPYLQNLGLDSKYSTKIGNILNGNGDAILTDTTNQVVDNLVSDPVANAVVKGAVDIVKTVLIGNYNKGQDIKEAGQNLSDISSITTMGSQIADAGNSSSEQIVQTLQGNMDNKSAEVDEAVAVITTNAQEGTKQIEETVEKNKEITDTIAKNQEQIDKNNAQIQEKQQRLN